MFEKIKKAIEHNTGQAVAVIVIAVLAVWMFGCETKVSSLQNPAIKVTRVELANEKDRIVADVVAEIGRLEMSISATGDNYAVRVKHLDQFDAVKAMAAELGMIVASGGKINPFGALASLMAIYGLGAVVDNRKKDGIITDIKKNN